LGETGNNYLLHESLAIPQKSEAERYADAKVSCANGNESACSTKKELEQLSLGRDMKVAKACNEGDASCTQGLHEALNNGSSLSQTKDGKLLVTSPEYASMTAINPQENASANSTHNQMASNLSSGLLITGAGAATAAGGGMLYDMGAVAQTTLLTDAVSAKQWTTSIVAGGSLAGIIHLATDPNATPTSTAVNVVAGGVGGASKLGLNAAAGLANQWIPTTTGNLITYGSSWGASHLISNNNSAMNQAINPTAGTSVWTSPVFTCGPYPRNPC
jgi:hypothetical protein